MEKIIISNENSEPIKNRKGKTVGKRVFLSEFGRKVKQKEEGVSTNPLVPGAADYILNTLYDRYTSAAAAALATNFQFFVVPNGQSGKTKVDTNLTQAGQLPAPQWFNVMWIGFYFSPLMQLSDIQTFTLLYYTEFWIQDKIYAEGPVYMFPTPGGLQGQQSFATATLATFYTNGNTSSTNWNDLRLPAGIDLGGGVVTDGYQGIVLNSGQNFHLDCKSAAGYTLAAASGSYGGFNVMANLGGIWARQVQ